MKEREVRYDLNIIDERGRAIGGGRNMKPVEVIDFLQRFRERCEADGWSFEIRDKFIYNNSK